VIGGQIGIDSVKMYVNVVFVTDSTTVYRIEAMKKPA